MAAVEYRRLLNAFAQAVASLEGAARLETIEKAPLPVLTLDGMGAVGMWNVAADLSGDSFGKALSRSLRQCAT